MASLVADLFQYFCVALALLVPILGFLYNTSRVCRYHLKTLFWAGHLIAFSWITALFCLSDPFNPDNVRKVGGWVMFKVLKTAHALGIRMETRGEENFNVPGPFIVVSNHQSSLDILTIFGLAPARCTGMAKRELLSWMAGPMGLALRLVGAVGVDRRPGKSRASMDQVAKDLNDKNFRLWIFPEGTRNFKGGMLPFKKGAFHLALQAGIPIIPVVISSYKSFYDKKTYTFDDGRLIVTVLPAVSSKDYTEATVQEMADTVRTQMLKTFEATSAEIISEKSLQ